MVLGSTQPVKEMSTTNFAGGKCWQAHRHVSRFSIICGSLEVSQPHGPPRPVKGIAFFSFTFLPLFSWPFVHWYKVPSLTRVCVLISWPACNLQGFKHMLDIYLQMLSRYSYFTCFVSIIYGQELVCIRLRGTFHTPAMPLCRRSCRIFRATPSRKLTNIILWMIFTIHCSDPGLSVTIIKA
jgi:hypothetical protein